MVCAGLAAIVFALALSMQLPRAPVLLLQTSTAGGQVLSEGAQAAMQEAVRTGRAAVAARRKVEELAVERVDKTLDREVSGNIDRHANTFEARKSRATVMPLDTKSQDINLHMLNTQAQGVRRVRKFSAVGSLSPISERSAGRKHQKHEKELKR
jgi:hypothetical protein